jgi:serine/threonine protein kinase
VTAVAYLHAVGWVHKTIESKHIILARQHSDPPTGLGHVNLIGFSYARRQEKASTGSKYFDWKTEIYRHPNRQRFPKQDTDSETTTLNEGGTADRAGQPASNETKQEELEYFKPKHDVYSMGVVLLELGLWQNLENFETELHKASAEDREKALTSKSEKELPRLVGEKYQQLVTKCLKVDHTRISAQEVLRELEDIRM